MKSVLFGLLSSVLLVGCGQPDPPPSSAEVPSTHVIPSVPQPATAPADLAHYDGYGDTRFGMDEPTFEKAWGGELKGAPEHDSSCYYKTPQWVKLSADFSFMFEDGRFVRYDVGTTREAAPGGGKVGMTIADIRQRYGASVDVQPHKYVEGAKYLRIAAPTGEGMLIFETDAHGNVTQWHVGLPPQVDYVEGCG